MKPNEPEDVRAPRLKDRIAELLRLASSNEDGPSEDQVFGAVKALLNAVEPNSQPEDVQLDVELREAAQALLDIGKRDLTNPKYDGYFEALKLALLRRVSGKGAQARYWKCEAKIPHEWQFCELSPAPVPATPLKRMMVDPSTGLVHEYCPDCRGVCSEYIPATTQGTPE